MIVVDASAALAVLLNSTAAAALRERLFASGESMHAPHLIDVEVTQVLRRLARERRIDAAWALAALCDWGDLSVARYPHQPLLPRAWDLRENLTAYDAMYVALSEALAAPLATCDRKLATSAKRVAKIELF